jgi:hypothetical protein
MRSETIHVDEWSLEHCPCGCGAKLQHPGFRSAARHERELTRYAHLRKSNKQLFRMLVTNLWWELRLLPRRFREWSKQRLQRAELQRVRREMDLVLVRDAEESIQRWGHNDPVTRGYVGRLSYQLARRRLENA